MRVFSADLSLTASGICLAVDGKVTSWGLVPGKGTGLDRLIECLKVLYIPDILFLRPA